MSLGLAVSLVEGRVQLVLKERSIAPWLVVEELALEVPEVRFPIDLSGGASRFQHAATKLVRAELTIDLAALSAVLTKTRGEALREIVLRDHDGLLEIDARLAPARELILCAPIPGNSLELVIGEQLRFGTLVAAPDAVLEEIVAAARASAAALPRPLEIETTFTSLRIDLIPALLWAVFPSAGWKIPQHDRARILDLHISEGSLTLEIGTGVAEAEAPSDAALKMLARADVLSRFPPLEAENTAQRFERLRAELDPSGGPAALVHHLFLLGSGDPKLFADVADLARDEITVNGSAAAWLALARVNAEAEAWLEAARRFDYWPRAKALSLLHAAKICEPGRALSLLDEAASLVPEDTEVLRALIDTQKTAGRAAAAVAMARRLARIALATAERAAAHVIAGRLLLEALNDPIGAKREMERALALEPDHPEALDGLASALLAHGDRRRAAALLEKLIDRAVAAGDPIAAAERSTQLGDLWRGIDGDAARLRYRRALELDPQQVIAALRLAEMADGSRGAPGALEAIELSLVSTRNLSTERRLALHLHAGRLSAALPGRERDAIAHLEAAASLAPNDVEPLEALIELLRRLDRLTPQHLARAAELWLVRGDTNKATRSTIEEARLLDRLRQPVDGAKRRLQQIVAADPAQKDALDASIELAVGSPADLIAAIDARLRLETPPLLRAELLTKRGEALFRLGRRRDALGDFGEALELCPADPRALAALQGLLGGTGDHEALAVVLGRVAARAEGTTKVALLSQRVRALAAAGRESEAYEQAKAIIEADPQALDLLPIAAALGVALGDLAGAKLFIERRLGTQPEPSNEQRLQLELQRARIAERTGDVESRIAALSAAMERALGLQRYDEARAIAAGLADKLASEKRLLALASLERRRAEWPGISLREATQRALEAARLFDAAGDRDAADEALAFAHQRAAAGGARVDEVLEVGESIARRSADPQRIALWIARRADQATGEAQIELRLQEAAVLSQGGYDEQAADRLERALIELPHALPIAERLAEIARRLGRLGVAARALARAAAILEQRGDLNGALALHRRAAAAFAELGQPDRAVAHDRALVERGDPKSEAAREALRRIERHARSAGDPTLLAEVLERASRIEEAPAAIERLLEKAAVERDRLDAPEAALVTLRRARALNGDRPDPTIDREIEGLLEGLGRYEELAMAIADRASHAGDPKRAAELQLEAAAILQEKLGSSAAALARAKAALAVDPENFEARELRRRILRDLDLADELADVLLEDAARARGEEQAALALEAAEVLAPLAACQDGAPYPPNATALSRALEVSRQVAKNEPKTAAPHRRVSTYARMLRRVEEEFLALGNLIEWSSDPVERLLAQLRRVDLLRGPLEDPTAAQAEMSAIVAAAEELDEQGSIRFEEQLARAGHLSIELDERGPLDAVLRLGARITEQSRDWPIHLQYLTRILALTEAPHERADLHFRIGELTEWQLGNGDTAERQYLAALAIVPNHHPSTEALTSFYLAVDRFGDLAENLGVVRLQRIWRDLREKGAPPQRIIAAGEALWPRLPPGSVERGEVLLALADLYRTVRDEAEGAVMLLDLVVREGPVELEPSAIDRLRVLFLEEERYDLYVEILRRQAERTVGDAARGRALAELGEALEWKLGDGVAAEREYRSALAADPSCESARTHLATLLASQDRYFELGSDLGRETLAAEIQKLADRGPRDRDRLWRAGEAYASLVLPAQRAAAWLEIAERLSDAEERRQALRRAAEETGEDAKTALEALRAMDAGPPPLASVPQDAPTIFMPAFETMIAEELEVPSAIGPATVIARLGWRQQIIATALAKKDRRAVESATRALWRSPLDPALLSALIAALIERGEQDRAAGPAEVLRSRWPDRAALAPSLGIVLDRAQPGVWRSIAADVLAIPLGKLLAESALETAASLPRNASGAERKPAEIDAIPRLIALLELKVNVELDPSDRREVWIEPGDPPVLVFTEAALRDPIAARFSAARALMGLRLGRLVLDRPEAEMSAVLRARFAGENADPGSIGRLREAARRVCDAFGVLAAGGIAPLIAAIDAPEEEAWSAPRVLDVLRFLAAKHPVVMSDQRPPAL